MPDTKISAELTAGFLDGTELTEIVQSGNNRKTTIQEIANLAALTAEDISGLAAVAISGSASDLGAGTLPNGRLSAVPNSALANSSITIAGHTVSLGGSQTLAASDLANGTNGSGQIMLATGGFDQTLGHTFWSGPTVGQHRLTDRVFMGAAVADTGFNATPQSDWMSQLNTEAGTHYNGGPGMEGSGDYAQVYILGDINAVSGAPPNQACPHQALVVGNASLNSISTGPNTYSTPRAMDILFVNNPLAAPTGGGPNVPAWAVYMESHRVSTHAGQTYGIELEMRNSVAAVTGWTPYATGGYGTIGVSLGCGAGLSSTGQFPGTAALLISTNLMQWGAGILFLDDSLGPYGPGGSYSAIGLPYNYAIQWFNPSLQSSIYNDITNFHIDTTGALVMNASSSIDVGLGTASPINNGGTYSTLTLNGSVGGAVEFMHNGTSCANIYTTNGSFDINTYAGLNFPIIFSTDGANERMRITPGGTINFAAPSWSANGSVATSLGSVGPAGSHTTVQKWFTISDGSNTYYIPAF